MGSLVTDDGSVIGGSALPNKFGKFGGLTVWFPSFIVEVKYLLYFGA